MSVKRFQLHSIRVCSPKQSSNFQEHALKKRTEKHPFSFYENAHDKECIKGRAQESPEKTTVIPHKRRWPWRTWKTGDGEWSSCVKSTLCRHRTWMQIPTTHAVSWIRSHVPVTSAPGEWWHEFLKPLVTQASQKDGLQFQWETISK